MTILASLLLLLTWACVPQADNQSPTTHFDGHAQLLGGQNIHVEVEPTGEIAQVFYFVSAQDLLDGLALRPKIQISGFAVGTQKYLDLDSLNENRDNQARFSDIIALPKANKISFLTPRIPAASAHLASDSAFKLDILAGLSYAFILNPNGLYDRAPLYLNLDQIFQDSQFKLNLEEPGQLITGHMSSLEAQKNSWQARIVQGNRLVSSVAQVPDAGHFSLELAHQLFLGNDSPLTLILEPQSPESPLPRFKKVLNATELSNHPDLGRINMGHLNKPLVAQINIAGPGVIYLKGLVGPGEVRVKKPIDSSGTTIFEELYEGTYDIAVVPPMDSPWGMRVVKNVDISGQDTKFSLKCPKRQKIDATVISARGERVGGAQVEFFRVGEVGTFATEDIFADELFQFTAITNHEGQVCQRGFGTGTANSHQCEGLALDEGRYMAHVIPPAGSPHAHQWQSFDFPKVKRLELTLRHHDVLVGTVLGPDQSSRVEGAYITIYLSDSNTDNQPKVVANAITDEQGVFRALIPTPK